MILRKPVATTKISRGKKRSGSAEDARPREAAPRIVLDFSRDGILIGVTVEPQAARQGTGPPDCVAAALGIDVRNRAAFIKAIQAGFALPVAQRLADILELGDEGLAAAAGISRRMLARRRREGRFRPVESDRLSRLVLLLDQASRPFDGDLLRAARWLRSEKAALGGATPLNYATTEPGAQQVRDLLDRLA